MKEDVIDDSLSGMGCLPIFRPDAVKSILDYQIDDSILEIKVIMQSEAARPDEHYGMVMSEDLKTYYRNEDHWVLAENGILFRKWFDKTESVTFLPVVGRVGLKKLFLILHPEAAESPVKGPVDCGFASHPSIKKTFNILKGKFYAFSMRCHLIELCRCCAICKQNNYVTRVKRDQHGMTKSLQSYERLEMDFCGPLSGGQGYILLFIDCCTNFIWAYHSANCRDESIMKGFQQLRVANCGLPASVVCDNAVLRRSKATFAFLKLHGCEVLHGQPFVSRGQGRAERGIPSLTRKLMKLSASMKIPIKNLVSQACINHNLSESDVLGGRCPADLHYSRSRSLFVNFLSPCPVWRRVDRRSLFMRRKWPSPDWKEAREGNP